MEEVGKILPKVLEPQWSRLDPPVIAVLAPLWTRVAGKALAKECRPVAFRGGTLTLVTEHDDWAEPLRQIAEEIRARVNEFLGKPVVKLLKILRASQLDRRDRSPWRPKYFLVSEAQRKDWQGQAGAMPAHLAQAAAQTRAKHTARNRGKVY